MKKPGKLATAAAVAAFGLAAFGLSTTSAAADTIQPGQTAPASVVKQIEASEPVTIGSVSVRPIPPAANGVRSATPAGTTLVARATDNLVGTSTNDLVVICSDVGVVQTRVAAIGGGITMRVYPEMGMVIVHAPRFEQLLPIKQQLAQALPAAKFDLPVRYFDKKPQ
ncbi:MAG TPA: hypothetical protein VGL08_12725 [Paraburkholderia sp.]|jgi:hypothetical protein